MIDDKLTPTEVVAWLSVFGGNMADTAASTIRKQHEAIKTLREALQELADNADDPYTNGWCGAIARTALEATKEFDK